VEGHEVTFDGTNFIVHDFEDAARLVRLDGNMAKRLGDLYLHCHDLTFARRCLESIDLVDPPLAKEALWRSAIVHWGKCFGSDSRFQLSIKMYEAGIQRDVFEYFKALRNKHIVHDDNAYHQAIPVGVIAAPGGINNVEEVICLDIRGDTLGPENFGNLRLLITTALDWTTKEIDKQANVLKESLEMRPRTELLAMPIPTWTAPTAADVALGSQTKKSEGHP
jgi:hypothetical protein